MRKCEGCGKPDAPFYEYSAECTCRNKRNEIRHGIDKHEADCFRVQHLISPYLTNLRRARKTDQFDEGRLLPVPGKPFEYARLVENGFRIILINGFIFSERILCADCIRVWVEREENRKHFERAKRGSQPQNYYQLLTS